MTKDLGEIKGRILVFGGVYSNLQALLKMKQIAEDLRIPPSNIICTGDVVGYCAQPEESVQEIIKWDIHTIAGNVEIQLREKLEDCGCNFSSGSRCNIFSNQWYPFAQSQLSQKSLDWMLELPEFMNFQYAGRKVYVLHGAYHHTSEYIFKSTPWATLEKNFQDTNSNLILAGHCGLPFYMTKKQQSWINAGVIGMPANDGTPKVWYVILDDKAGTFSFRHKNFDYDFQQAARLIRQQQLPAEYALTLETGIWDNCEILPKKETALQGKKIFFDQD